MCLPRDNVIESVGFHITQHVVELDGEVGFTAILLLGDQSRALNLRFGSEVVIFVFLVPFFGAATRGSPRRPFFVSGVMVCRGGGCHGVTCVIR